MTKGKKKPVKGEQRDRDLLAEVLKSNAEQGRENYTVITKANNIRIVAKNDAPLLAYDFGSDLGRIGVLLDTWGLADFMVESCERLIDACLEGAVMSNAEGKTAPLDKMSRTNHRGLAEALAKTVVKNFIFELQHKLSTALDEYDREIFILAEGLVRAQHRKAVEALGLIYSEPVDMQKKLKLLVDEMAKSRRNFLRGSLERVEGKPSFDRLDQHYQALKPKYRDAQRTYKKFKSSAKWREHVALEVPEAAQYDDRLTRLAGRPEDMTPELAADVMRTGANSSPAHLAIEHAARLCGFPRYSHAVSVLYRKRKGGRGEPEREESPEEAGGVH